MRIVHIEHTKTGDLTSLKILSDYDLAINWENLYELVMLHRKRDTLRKKRHFTDKETL